MATKKAQRIGIWIIVITFAISSIAVFVVLILSTQNDKNDQQKLADACVDYTKRTDERTIELSSMYFDKINKFASRVGGFDKEEIEEVSSTDLIVGDGNEINESSTYSAYYIGWNPDGVIFDQSISGNSLKSPFTVSPGGVIAGWTEGTVGMKLGGIREIAIPSEKAYGESGSGENIPPNTPIKFIVLAIDSLEPLSIPDPLKEYKDYIDAGYISYVCQ